MKLFILTGVWLKIILLNYFFLDFNTVQDIKISKIESNSISGSYVNPTGQFDFINIKCFNDKKLYEGTRFICYEMTDFLFSFSIKQYAQ